MTLDNKASDLFYTMVSYSKNIYKNMQILCDLEKDGKKNEKAYFNHITNLKQLLKEEIELYNTNKDLIYSKRGHILFLTLNNLLDDDKNIFDLLSCFHESIIYERIKTKIKYYIGLKKTFGNDLFKNLKPHEYDKDPIPESFLESAILSDIQKVSIYYIDKEDDLNSKNIEYKYLSSMLFNLESELLDSFFEISRNSIYVGSSLIYTLSGIYDEIYQINRDESMMKKFQEVMDYIISESLTEDENKEYKIKIAFSFLKSILDLLSPSMKEQVYNDFIVDICDDFAMNNNLKLKIINNLNKADDGRKLLRYITLK